jgi:hypothetical protein
MDKTCVQCSEIKDRFEDFGRGQNKCKECWKLYNILRDPDSSSSKNWLSVSRYLGTTQMDGICEGCNQPRLLFPSPMGNVCEKCRRLLGVSRDPNTFFQIAKLLQRAETARQLAEEVDIAGEVEQDRTGKNFWEK